MKLRKFSTIDVSLSTSRLAGDGAAGTPNWNHEVTENLEDRLSKYTSSCNRQCQNGKQRRQKFLNIHIRYGSPCYHSERLLR